MPIVGCGSVIAKEQIQMFNITMVKIEWHIDKELYEESGALPKYL